MKEGSSLQQQLNEFNTLISRLAAADVKIDMEENFALLLCSMLESWDSLIMNLNIDSNVTWIGNVHCAHRRVSSKIN